MLALEMAKRVGELQALSSPVAFRGLDLSLSYLPEFVAKTESERNPLPRSFSSSRCWSLLGTFRRNAYYVLSAPLGLI